MSKHREALRRGIRSLIHETSRELAEMEGREPPAEIPAPAPPEERPHPPQGRAAAAAYPPSAAEDRLDADETQPAEEARPPGGAAAEVPRAAAASVQPDLLSSAPAVEPSAGRGSQSPAAPRGSAAAAAATGDGVRARVVRRSGTDTPTPGLEAARPVERPRPEAARPAERPADVRPPVDRDAPHRGPEIPGPQIPAEPASPAARPAPAAPSPPRGQRAQPKRSRPAGRARRGRRRSGALASRRRRGRAGTRALPGPLNGLEAHQVHPRKGVCVAYFVNHECWRVPDAYCNTALQICAMRDCPVYRLHREALERRFAGKYKHFW